MDPKLAVLCAPPRVLQGINGHGARFYRVYVNKTGTQAMMEGGTFPAGSSIVKEKLIPKGKDYEVELLTVMVKRMKGYSPGSQDWEFYVAHSQGERITSPKEIADCTSCHRDRLANDFGVPHLCEWPTPVGRLPAGAFFANSSNFSKS